jgi:hypothetical protein
METMTAPHRSGGTEPGEHGALAAGYRSARPRKREGSCIRMRALLIVGLLLLAVIAALYSLVTAGAGTWSAPGIGQYRDDRRRGEFQDSGPGSGAFGVGRGDGQGGQIVARLDTSELGQEVALRKAEVRAAEASLAELETGSRPEEIAQSEAVVRRAQAEVERARGRFQAPQDAL